MTILLDRKSEKQLHCCSREVVSGVKGSQYHPSRYLGQVSLYMITLSWSALIGTSKLESNIVHNMLLYQFPSSLRSHQVPFVRQDPSCASIRLHRVGLESFPSGTCHICEASSRGRDTYYQAFIQANSCDIELSLFSIFLDAVHRRVLWVEVPHQPAGTIAHKKCVRQQRDG